MVLTAHHIRTSLAVLGAGAAVVAALLLSPRTQAPPPIPIVDGGEDGMVISARLTSSQIQRGEQTLAVSITMPPGPLVARPPLSLAVVLDRSGSMNGEPIRNAKAAASQLIEQLDPADAFTIITFSSGVETVVPMTRVTPASKAAARVAIERVYDDGGTCTSCGIERGAAELARSPIAGGLARIVLISDGQANEGLWDRGELAQLVANTASHGVSVSTVGVGLDFDEVTMTQLAEVGRGNYYFVEDTANLSAMFAREIDGLSETVASNVQLVLTPSAGVTIAEAYGYPLTRQGTTVAVPIADLRGGETHKVVLRLEVTSPVLGPLVVTQVQVGWRRVFDGATRTARTTTSAELVDDPAKVAATVDIGTLRIAEEAKTAHALDEATRAYEEHGSEAAQQILQRRNAAMRANAAALGADEVDKLGAAQAGVVDSFFAEPAKAKKAVRQKAYQLSR